MDFNRNKVKEYNFKVIVIGDAAVGKSSLIARILNGYPNTVKFHHSRLKSVKSVSVGDRLVKLHIHDTAGQERYRSLTQSFYRGTHGCLLVFDTRNQISFDNINSWMKELDLYTDCSKVAIAIIGTNCCSPDRVVDRQTLENYANHHELDFYELDTVCDVNVSDISEKLSATMVKKLQENSYCHFVLSDSTLSLKKPRSRHKIVDKLCQC